jgi:FtsH-binding integral membrane protein
MNKAYAWMVAGLTITGFSAEAIFSSGLYYSLVQNSTSMWIILLLMIGIVMGLNGAIHKISSVVAGSLFVAFSLLMGVSLSSIFAVYTEASIARTFFISAGMFAGLSAYGFITKRNLTGMGNFMLMGLFGIILVGLVNIFLQSPAFYWVQSLFGVVIFSGLTAWDTQKLKEMATFDFGSESMASKGAIIGALTLYLDFINLFLYLLRFLGNRED